MRPMAFLPSRAQTTSELQQTIIVLFAVAVLVAFAGFGLYLYQSRYQTALAENSAGGALAATVTDARTLAPNVDDSELVVHLVEHARTNNLKATEEIKGAQRLLDSVRARSVNGKRT